MARKKRRSEPTGIELFLYWWEVTGQEGKPERNFRLHLYDADFRKWLNGWKPRQQFFNVCRQAARQSVGSLFTPTSRVEELDGGTVTLNDAGRRLVQNWLDSLLRNDNTPVAAPEPLYKKKLRECDEEQTVYQPTVKYPVGTDEMIGVVAENYRHRMPVGSFTEGFKAGAKWVLSMDPVTLSYLRGELNDEKA